MSSPSGRPRSAPVGRRTFPVLFLPRLLLLVLLPLRALLALLPLAALPAPLLLLLHAPLVFLEPARRLVRCGIPHRASLPRPCPSASRRKPAGRDRKSTRLN